MHYCIDGCKFDILGSSRTKDISLRFHFHCTLFSIVPCNNHVLEVKDNMATSRSDTSSTTLQNTPPNSDTSSNHKTPSLEDIELDRLDIENQEQRQTQTEQIAAPLPANRNRYFRAENRSFDENKVLRALQKSCSKTRTDYFWTSVLAIWLLMAIIGIPVSVDSSLDRCRGQILTLNPDTICAALVRWYWRPEAAESGLVSCWRRCVAIHHLFHRIAVFGSGRDL